MTREHEGGMSNTDGERGERDDEALGALVRELDPVPEVPREALWARIQEERARRTVGVIPFRRRVAGPAWRMARPAWGVAAVLAATLVVGVGIGRMSRAPVTGPNGASGLAATDPAAEAANAADAAEPYRMAAITHLVSSQALLTSFPADADAGRTGEVADWAGKLLLTTRLLRDTPAGEDPQIGTLLADLEIVLAQLAALPVGGSEGSVRTELEIINDGIDRRNVLPRIRVATAARGVAEP